MTKEKLMNSIQLVGRLGQDPELRYTQSGKAVCNFSLCTNEGGKDEVQWHRIVVWEKQAENASLYLKKGKKAGVVGYLTYRQWESKDGVKQTSAEIVARNVEYLSDRDPNDPAPAPIQNSTPQQGSRAFQPKPAPAKDPGGFAGKMPTLPDDDIPF